MEKCVSPEVDQGSIRVAITAQRKVQNRISSSDITATADLQQAISLDTTPVMVPITASCPGIPGGGYQSDAAEFKCLSG